jgi:DNA-binding transcriptional LysR family regulator
MDVNRLRVIDAVQRTGSITGAAAELHYAQASVSHHLARLQEDVGATLTRRAGRGIELTPEGELLARRAREILGRLADAEAEVGALSRQLRSRLRIAAFQSALLELVPPALVSMRTARSEIALELRESHPEDSLDLLRENEVDVALVHRADDAPVAPDLVAVRLYDDPVLLLSTTPDDTVAANRDASWIAGCERCRRGIHDLCAAAGFEPNVALRTEDIHVQASFVSAGLGVITMPGLALRSLDMRRLHASPLPGVTRRVWAVTTPGHTEIVTDFIESIRAAVGQLGLVRA